MVTLYGIKNCDTMKKARTWLDQQGIEYRFHDYKTEGVPAEEFAGHLQQLGWEALVNRRGTTWRKLPEAVREGTSAATALALICEHSSLIKRPLLVAGEHRLLGFNADQYAAFFDAQP
ncbi:ArsC family reductase [Aestuariirhabdus litorea]|uniref:ArsC family reductase n=1 Tax=Aestuariirhabdus litorea TaxID=2528527 RepID=A0A3P3VRN8_9GAMM|nr:ArsC family reductase [Aestuariirhabdus litorea]RRJ85114.1 ArsC family reductase [Aestuariirhabdus litorea]RWW98339.1 ArsC family reductase [Endozoicomonadaceae bacterium GTF-13]